MIKKEDGWHLLATRSDLADVSDFYEDKLAIDISRSATFGSGESTYLGTKPLPDKPVPIHGLGYHYTAEGDLMDVWQWKASRGGHLGYVDDQYFDVPRPTTPAEAAGKTRYQAGYWNDPGRAFLQLQLCRRAARRLQGPRQGPAPAEGLEGDPSRARPVRPRPREQRRGRLALVDDAALCPRQE